MVDQTIAVVDLETTAPNHKDGRIIQIGIALIQNDKIISTFSTDVNPGVDIPQKIEKLTGITNAQVKVAPFFEEVAGTIVSLLTDTIFVAHNIRFDYSFLNAELRRIGFPELNLCRFDTVELAQIFLPTAASFRLRDLAKKLNLEHDRPHQADSDAYVTAQLFLKIKEIIATIPDETLKQLAFLSPALSVDNDLLIRQSLVQRRRGVTKRDDQMIVEGIILKKQEVPVFQEDFFEKSQYPTSAKRKEVLFHERGTDKITFFEKQSSYANDVYRFFSQESETHDFFLEANSEFRKSFGYLFPISYLATKENPAIVSTSSIFLQNQLLKEVRNRVNVVAPTPLQAAVVKADSHYLNLAAFAKTLEEASDLSQFAAYQMSTLVWLLETTTGDLDEMSQKNDQHVFFEQVRHWGVSRLKKENPFYSVDFLRLQSERVKNSNLLIVNYAFLAREMVRETPALPSSDFLIFDEAQRLPEILLKSTRIIVDPVRLSQKIERFVDKNESPLVRFQIPLLREVLQEVSFVLVQFTLSLGSKEEGIEEAEESYPFQKFLADGKKLKIHSQDLEKIYETFVDFPRENISVFEERLRETIRRWFSEILEELKNLASLMTDKRSNISRSMLWKKTQGTPILIQVDFNAPQLVFQFLQGRSQKRLYTSSTLISGGNKEFLPKSLQVPAGYRIRRKKSSVNQDHLRVYLPKEFISKNVDDFDPERIVSFLEKLANVTSSRMLVLFSNLVDLKVISSKLQGRMMDEGREVLAQTSSGMTDKLIYRFLSSKNAILLGAKSFWENGDSLKESLELVVVVELPIENSKSCWVKDFSKYLETQGEDAQKQYFSPQIKLDLQQISGWLSRSETKKGTLIFLDPKIKLPGFKKAVLSSKEVKIEEMDAIFSQLMTKQE